jgi:transcriptional regulator with XRE-family HTH domain
MEKNNLKRLREEANLTQKAVADAASISQQHMQRLEAGTSPVRLPVAEKIAAALSTTIEHLFPQLAEVVRRDHAILARNDLEARNMIDEWERAGIDVDAGFWHVYWNVAGHGTSFAQVSGATARRLIEVNKGKANSGFVVFDSATHRYAIALHEDVEMEFKRVLEPDEMDEELTLSLDYRKVKIYNRRRNSYRDYYPDPDEGVLYQDVNKRVGMQMLFNALETGSTPRVSIVTRHDDETSEEAQTSFIPVVSILAVEAPLSLVDPAFRQAMEDGRKVHPT